MSGPTITTGPVPTTTTDTTATPAVAPKPAASSAAAEQKLHDDIDKKNRDNFGTTFGYDPISKIWAGSLRYQPTLRGVGMTMEGSGNDKLGQVGGHAGGRIGISATGAPTPKVGFTIGGSLGVGYEDAGNIKYVTGELSAMGLVRYKPRDWVQFNLSATATFRATGSYNQQKTNNDITLSQAAVSRLQSEMTSAITAFTSGVQADMAGLAPDAQQRLQAAIMPALNAFSAQLPQVLAGALLNPGSAQTAITNLVQNTEQQIISSVNGALGGAAADFETKLRSRVSDFQTAMGAAFDSATSSASSLQNPTGGSFGANVETSGGVSFHLPLGHTPFYAVTGVNLYLSHPLFGDDAHTVMPLEHNPTLTTFGTRDKIGIGMRIPGTELNVVTGVDTDFSLSGGKANTPIIMPNVQLGMIF